MMQMIHEGPAPANAAIAHPITDLDDSHIPEMIEFTQLTKPGYVFVDKPRADHQP